MSRSGYTEDLEDQWAFICWRGAVNSAIKGKRGQAFLRELMSAMDALPKQELIADAIEDNGSFCALGAVAHARGVDTSDLPYESNILAVRLGIPRSLAAEITYMNDEAFYHSESSDHRFSRMRRWIGEHINEN